MLSRFELHRRKFTTLILRNVLDRVEAEQKIRSLTAETELLREELYALHHDEALIGESQALRYVLRDIGQVAKTDATVLILGETGTGKELVAHAIHAASTRRARQLIIVNCAAIPTTLIESELFGHEAGAFTGATKKRDGRFAMADKSTLLLDEIGELPLDLQGFLGLSDKVRPGYKEIRVHFTIEADAPAEQLKELAKFSPVHDIVSNPVPVSIHVDKR